MGKFDKCRVMGCNVVRENPRASLFFFPKDVQRFDQWCINLNIDKENVGKRSVICGSHFENNQFRSEKRTRLKASAIPRPIHDVGHSPVLNGHSPTSSLAEAKQIRRGRNNPDIRLPLGSTNSYRPILPKPTSHSTVTSPCPIMNTSNVGTVTSQLVLTVQNSEATSPKLPSQPKLPDPVATSSPISSNDCQDFSVPLDLSHKDDNNEVIASPGMATDDMNSSILSSMQDSPNISSVSPGDLSLSSQNLESESLSPTINTVPIRTPPVLRIKKKARREITRLKKKIRRLEMSNDRQENINLQKIEDVFGKNSSIFEIIKSQWSRYSSTKKMVYTDMEKILAFTIYYKCGRRGYKSLQALGLRLPVIRSIQRWLSKVSLQPGLNSVIFDYIKERASYMNEYEKDCVLLLDEMRVKQCIVYNKIKDEFEGIHDHGHNNRKLKPAKEALVFMVRSLTTNWAFPLSFYFSHGSTESKDLKVLLEDNLKSALDVGLKVRVVVSDMSYTNQGLFRGLGVTVDKPFMCISDQKVYVINDIPHLIKLVRTHIERHGFGDTVDEASWQYLKQFYELDSSTENRLAPKLTHAHFNLTDMTRMKVKLATQLLSRSVYAGIKTMVMLKKMPTQALGTARFVKKLNDMFDLLNISVKDNYKNPIKSGSAIFNNLDQFTGYQTWVSKWVCLDGAKLPDCVRGLRQTLLGVVMLLKDLRSQGYSYVLTRKIQQDSLEHYFSFQRGRGGYVTNPTCSQFRDNFKYLFMTILMKNSDGANCEYKEESELLYKNAEKLKFFLEYGSFGHTPSQDGHSPNNSESEFEESGADSSDEFLNPNQCTDFFKVRDMGDLGVKDNNVILYVAGWAVKASLRKTKCETCTERLFGNPSSQSRTETMLHNRQYETAHSRFCDVMNSSCQLMFQNLITSFREAVLRYVNSVGTKIAKNVIGHLEQDNSVYRWLNEIPGCKKHRHDIIRQVVIAKLFLLVREQNQKLKTLKSTRHTLRQLRHD